MGNAVISGILFQPPSPPNELDWLSKSSDDITERQRILAKKQRAQNISVNYLWLYSIDNKNGSSTSNEPTLIPAIHITHNEPNSPNANLNNNGNNDPASMVPPQFQASKRYTLLYSHGNAEDLGLISTFLVDLARLLQINVLCYDYSGYGISTTPEYVSEFYKAYGKEVRDWTLRKRTKGGVSNTKWGEVTSKINGERCRYSNELFVAPVVHPSSETMFDESVYDDMVARDGVENEGEDNNAYDFTNACGDWATTEDSLGVADGNVAQAGSRNESPVVMNDNIQQQRSSASASPTKSIHANSTSEKDITRILDFYSWKSPSSSETNCYTNIYSAYSYLTTVEHVPPQHVILYGKSVGSGPTCWLAQRLCRGENDNMIDGTTCNAGPEGLARCGIEDGMCHVVDDSREPSEHDSRSGSSSNGSDALDKSKKSVNAPGGVVLHSPFLSVIRVVLDVGFTTIGDLFPNFDRVGDFTCPVYVIHGSNDAIVPFYHGQTLFQALPDPSKTVPFWARGAGHNNIEMDMPTAYIKRLQQFVRQCDRFNYPGGIMNKMANMTLEQHQNMLLQQSLQASLRQSSMQQAQVQQQQTIAGKFGNKLPMRGASQYLTRYASQDSYHVVSNKPSKQRKQKGTLVMRSLHNHNQQQQAPPPPPASPPSRMGSFTRTPSFITKHRKNWASPSKHTLTIDQQQKNVSSTNNTVTDQQSSRYHRSMSAITPSSGMQQQQMPPLSHTSSPYAQYQQQQQVYGQGMVVDQRYEE